MIGHPHLKPGYNVRPESRPDCKRWKHLVCKCASGFHQWCPLSAWLRLTRADDPEHDYSFQAVELHCTNVNNDVNAVIQGT
jgi:hypothetical protein